MSEPWDLFLFWGHLHDWQRVLKRIITFDLWTTWFHKEGRCHRGWIHHVERMWAGTSSRPVYISLDALPLSPIGHFKVTLVSNFYINIPLSLFVKWEGWTGRSLSAYVISNHLWTYKIGLNEPRPCKKVSKGNHFKSDQVKKKKNQNQVQLNVRAIKDILPWCRHDSLTLYPLQSVTPNDSVSNLISFSQLSFWLSFPTSPTHYWLLLSDYQHFISNSSHLSNTSLSTLRDSLFLVILALDYLPILTCSAPLNSQKQENPKTYPLLLGTIQVGLSDFLASENALNRTWI